MSITRQRSSGRVLMFRRSISEITTLEKSTLVMTRNPASYKCSERREFPHPGTRIWSEPEEEEDDSWRRGKSESRSWGHSAYHSKESSLPLRVKNLSQFSLLVKSSRVCKKSSEEAAGAALLPFFFPISAMESHPSPKNPNFPVWPHAVTKLGGGSWSRSTV